MKKLIALSLSILMLLGQTAQASVYNLPAPSQIIPLSKAYSHPVLKGIKVDPLNPFKLEFILDKEDKTKEKVSKEEVNRLVKYFLAALTIPEDNLWVNLSPYERDRITSKDLGLTDLGKDMLGQDYILKQLLSSLTHPNSKIGKQYWGKIYDQVHKIAGTTKIPINTFNKVWIVLEKAKVHEHNNAALITDVKLQAMSEQDYLALSNNQIPVGDGPARPVR